MPLSQEQKLKLNQKIMSISAPLILKNYIKTGAIVYPDDLPVFDDPDAYIQPPLTPEQHQALAAKRQWLNQVIGSQPNAVEQAEWAEVKAHGAEQTRSQLDRLNAYIAHWGTKLPTGHHVNEARQMAAAFPPLPDPAEQTEWADVKAHDGEVTAEQLERLNKYVTHWQNSRPAGHHVDEALAQTAVLKDRIAAVRDAAARAHRDAASHDWDNLTQNGDPTLEQVMAYKQTYGDLTERMQMVDNAAWAAVLTAADKVQAAQTYKTHFPAGSHYAEADNLLEAASAWTDVANSGDLFAVSAYIRQSAAGPFLAEARQLLDMLKQQELKKMRDNKSGYPLGTFRTLRREGIFTDEELCLAGLASADSLHIMDNLDSRLLPDIFQEAAKCRQVCAAGSTDVFFFGIPSTGKSCVLMGLLGSTKLDVDYAYGGGPYAAALDLYRQAGATIGTTPSDFAVTIKTDYVDGKNNRHPLNLVEMAGEDFACKLADNPDGKTTFADMGTGVPQLLSNGNRKIFFLIVDPTARMIAFNHRELQKDATGNVVKDEYGRPRWTERKVIIDQTTLLKKTVSLMAQPENSDIMRHTDAINIIVTKADCFGPRERRMDAALDFFKGRYDESFIRPLTTLCRKYGINATRHKETDGRPRLYTFSLGQFYVGDIYRFDPTDADTIVDVLSKNSNAVRPHSSIFDKISDWFNS